MKTIGIIGTGNMGSALAAAICRATSPECVVLSDANVQKAASLAAELGCKSADNETVARECDMLLLAVKPQVMQALLQSLAPVLKSRAQKPLLISIAAGLSIATLTAWAGGDYPLVRIMPNTPALVGEGMLLYATNDAVSGAQLSVLLSLLRYAGKNDRVTEAQMDAAGSLSGCGPAFVCVVADALADGAVRCGIPKEKALEYAWQTLLGTAVLAQKTGKHPTVLKDAVCSPGGTTICGVAALEEAGVRNAFMNAVTAAYRRSLELGKQ